MSIENYLLLKIMLVEETEIDRNAIVLLYFRLSSSKINCNCLLNIFRSIFLYIEFCLFRFLKSKMFHKYIIFL